MTSDEKQDVKELLEEAYYYLEEGDNEYAAKLRIEIAADKVKNVKPKGKNETH